MSCSSLSRATWPATFSRTDAAKAFPSITVALITASSSWFKYPRRRHGASTRRPGQTGLDAPFDRTCASEQPFDLASIVEPDRFRRRHARQARHGHDLAADNHNETGPRAEAHFAHRDGMPGRRAAQRRIGREAVLRLGHADRQVAIALIFPEPQLVADLLVGQNLVGAVDALGDALDLLEEAELVLVERGELRGAAVGHLGDLRGQLGRAFRAQLPVAADDGFRALRDNVVLHGLDLGLSVMHEMVDRHDDRHAEGLEVADVATEVGAALVHGLHVLLAEIGLGHTAVHLHGADRGYKHDAVRREARLAALDVHELLGPEIGAEARFRHNIVGQL